MAVRAPGFENLMKRPEVAAKNQASLNHPDVRARMSAAKLGDKNPMKRPEVSAKISAARTAYWARKRAGTPDNSEP